MNHRDRLNEVASRNGLPPLSGAQPPGDYISYALDLVCVETGMLSPQAVLKDRKRIELERRKAERKGWRRLLP